MIHDAVALGVVRVDAPAFVGAISGMVRVLVLLFSVLKFGKLAATGGTMLLSVAVYATIFGWPYAAGFVILLFVHELGHYIAARQRGLAVGAPMFIPFVGAWIQLKEQPKSVETEAYVAAAGPFLGTLGAFACFFLALAVDSKLLLAVSYAGFFLNLLNLLPLSPLDGGRITAIISPRTWLIGAPLLLALAVWRPSPMLILIAILALPHVTAAWRYDPKKAAAAGYYVATTAEKLEYGALYIGMTALLAIMTYEVHGMLGRVS
jgi:Zn-dependent protease